jgi:dienelactone hydrolase
MHSKRLTKFGCLLSAIVFILISADKCFTQSFTDDDIHISAIAELYFLQIYQQEKGGHKAMAVGPGGYWAAAERRTTPKAAETAAVSDCRKTLQTASKGLAKRSCVLFDVDGKPTGKATPIGIPFGTLREGRDYALEFGKMWEPSNTDRKGIMVMVHGCNPVGVMGGWMTSWINYYRAAGFQVFLPNSFAEPRDGELCGNPGEHGIDQQTRILKLRIAQTRQTLAELRKRFPKDPIYLHGHSEGGYVVQALGDKVAGIIVSGSPCGFGYSSAYWVAPGTPLLVIAGTKDPYIYKARNARELTAFCKTIRGAGKLTAVSVAGMGHFAAIWWPGVRDAVNALLGAEPTTVSRRKSGDIAFPNLTPMQLEDYRTMALPKALAADNKGNWGRSVRAETRLDAEETALFDCDQRAGADAFLDTSHQHACVLVDVNGKKLVK